MEAQSIGDWEKKLHQSCPNYATRVPPPLRICQHSNSQQAPDLLRMYLCVAVFIRLFENCWTLAVRTL